MRIERALDLTQGHIQRIREAYAVARIMGKTSAQLNTRLSAIYEEMRKQKLPKWSISKVQGYDTALRDEMYRNDLFFGAIVDGKLYSTHTNRNDYYGKHGISAKAFCEKTTNNPTIGHYWKREDQKIKPFFTGSME